MSQTEKIIMHMKRWGSIEPLTALDRYGCFRLAARINEMRSAGFNIVTERVERNGKVYARYRLL